MKLKSTSVITMSNLQLLCAAFKCPSNQTAQYPDITNCSFYFLCQNGSSVKLECANGTAFHVLSSSCVFAQPGQCPPLGTLICNILHHTVDTLCNILHYTVGTLCVIFSTVGTLCNILHYVPCVMFSTRYHV
jgi:hypothetical protein